MADRGAAPQVPTRSGAADDEEEERRLLSRVAAGDRPAFEALYRRYFGKIGRFVARLIRRPELVEETANDALWVVWRRAGDFRGASRVSTWIFGIAYRCALKSLRANEQGETLDAAVESGPDEFVAQELSDWVGRGLSLLPLEQRATLELAYYHGHSCEEIAAIMGCATGTVKARMFHARVRLRNVLPALGGAAGQEDAS